MPPERQRNVRGTIEGRRPDPKSSHAASTDRLYDARDVGADGRYVLVACGRLRDQGSSGGAQMVQVLVGQQLTLDLGARTRSNSNRCRSSTAPVSVKDVGSRDQHHPAADADAAARRPQLPEAAARSRQVVVIKRPLQQGDFRGDLHVDSVFIDGANLKNSILQGGFVDRGLEPQRPFSRKRSEFRVLRRTTRPSTNRRRNRHHHDVTKSARTNSTVRLATTRTRTWSRTTTSSEKRGLEARLFAGNLAGLRDPIIPSVLHFFVSYEAK